MLHAGSLVRDAMTPTPSSFFLSFSRGKKACQWDICISRWRYSKEFIYKVTLCRFNTIQKSLVTISELTCKERGIDLELIAPAGKKERIKELSQIKGNQEYRNALIETIADDLTDAEINRIISEINDYSTALMIMTVY
jgi:hypothetical protein